jgi:hypothetical protein
MSEQGPEADDTQDATEALWREIVDNYGERPVVDQVSEEQPSFVAPVHEPRDDDVYDYAEAGFDDEDDEDRFVPPIPPALPPARADRVAAWIGVLGTPAVVLVLLLSGLSVDPVIGWLLVAAFVGGFGYLVATMSQEPRDPWDDGAQL